MHSFKLIFKIILHNTELLLEKKDVSFVKMGRMTGSPNIAMFTTFYQGNSSLAPKHIR